MEVAHVPMKRSTTTTLPCNRASLDLISVMRRLTEVIRQENKCLQSGIPASLSDMVDAKMELSDACDEKWAVVRQAVRENMPMDQNIRDQLCAEAARLHEVAKKNAALLEAAMGATRRRIEAIMNAIRIQAGEQGKYGERGEQLLVHFIPVRQDLKI